MVKLSWNYEFIRTQHDECYLFEDHTKIRQHCIDIPERCNLCTTIEDAMAQGIGFSKVISMGNKVDMDENDLS